MKDFPFVIFAVMPTIEVWTLVLENGGNENWGLINPHYENEELGMATIVFSLVSGFRLKQYSIYLLDRI